MPVNTTASVFSVASQNQNDLSIQYDFDQPFQSFQPLSSKAPKVIQTASRSSVFNLFNSTSIVMNENTVLNTLIFTTDRFHAALTEGDLILDNRIESQKTTIQIANALLDPYPNGIFYLSKRDNQLAIQVLTGNAKVAIYNSQGVLKREFLLTKYSSIEAFDAFAEEGDIQISKLSRQNELFEESAQKGFIKNLSSVISSSNLFTLTYKQSRLQPESDNSILRLTSKLSFNAKRKNYYALVPFYSELNQLLIKSKSEKLTVQDLQPLKEIYLTSIANNLQALSQFRQNLNSKSSVILAIRPNENLYPLKVYLLTLANSLSPADRILSELEDLYYLFPANDYVQTSQSLERLSLAAPMLGKEDAINILAILDNLAEIVIQANTKDLFDARNLVAEKLTNTIEKSQFNTKTQQHLLRLESAYNTNQLSVTQVRSAYESLLSGLDPTSQRKYQDFLLELNS